MNEDPIVTATSFALDASHNRAVNLQQTLLTQITYSTLQSLLAQPPATRGDAFIRRQLPSVQRILIEITVVNFIGHDLSLVDDWIVPDGNAGEAEIEVAISAQRIIALLLARGQREPLHRVSVEYIQHIVPIFQSRFPLHTIFLHIFDTTQCESRAKEVSMCAAWENFINCDISIATRLHVPDSTTRQRLSKEYAFCLEFRVSRCLHASGSQKGVVYFLDKILKSYIPTFHLFLPLPNIERGGHSSGKGYSDMRVWRSLSTSVVVVYFNKFLQSVNAFLVSRSVSDDVYDERWVGWWMKSVLGNLIELRIEDSYGEKDSDVDLFQQLVISGSFSLDFARCFAIYVRSLNPSRLAIDVLVDKVLSRWGSKQEISHSTSKRHHYLTLLLILLHEVSSSVSVPDGDTATRSLSSTALFVSAMSHHLQSHRPEIRQAGLLTGEMVTARDTLPNREGRGDDGADQLRLKFEEDLHLVDNIKLLGDKEVPLICEEYEGMGYWRKLVQRFDGEDTGTRDAATFLPDRPLSYPQKNTNHAPIEVLEEPQVLEARISVLESSDPTEFQSLLPKPKSRSLAPPVYIADLCAYLTNSIKAVGMEDENENEHERVRIGLLYGTQLIRKKVGWRELEENAVNISVAVMSLNNKFELDGFDEKKQDLLTALVVTCPVIVVPCVIEHYFLPSYSVSQRTTMLAALALGSHELAGLSISKRTKDKYEMEEKLLPSNLHDRLVQAAIEDVRRAVQKGIPAKRVETLITTLSEGMTREDASKLPQKQNQLHLIATDVFIMPLVNRYWSYIRDMSSASAHGRTTPRLLNAYELKRVITMISVLVYGSRHAMNFASLVIPEILDLLLFFRSMVLGVENEVLECMLISFNAILEVNQSWRLVTCHHGAKRLDEVRVWAQEIFLQEEGQGSELESRAAAVVLAVGNIFDAWRSRVDRQI